ncbi:hypothetical protein L1987_09442 [Smallanthus sonchifolius]|uniref:Uncharacterized protein n=1 Tax=Smallanthus sonchifolius TaxID=185202 RepID=A0ACB9JNW6_9ASTR|nr:hypothetical protein L1987_09442 [Smallanthus sonchifolius]
MFSQIRKNKIRKSTLAGILFNMHSSESTLDGLLSLIKVEDGNSTLVCANVDSGGELDEANASMLDVDVDSEVYPEGFDVAVC